MTNHKLDTDSTVFFYEQEFYMLSNFSAFRVSMHGINFMTAEHAYHWHKFNTKGLFLLRRDIVGAPSAHDAFKIARAHASSECANWNETKQNVMKEILHEKAHQHEYVMRKLLETGDRRLIEDSWRDSYWGWGVKQDGMNMLGKLWMEVRDEIAMETPP